MNPESGYTTPGQRMAQSATSVTSGAAFGGTIVNYVAHSAPLGPPPNVPAISAGEELKWLDGELGTLHEQIRTLTQRLEPVLTPPGPDTDGCGSTPVMASPLVEKLRDNRATLENVNRMLSRLIGRIEL